VALARLHASQNLVVDTAEAAIVKEAAKNGQLSPGEIIRTSGQPVFPQAQRSDLEEASSRSKSSENNPPPMPMQQSLRAQQRSGSSASNASDEDTDDHKSGSRTQSRIDKWKAKHEAMLKMASDKKEQDKEHAAAEAASEDETPEIKPNCLTKIQTAAMPSQAAVLSVK